MKEWYGHIKDGCRLKGKEVGNRQYIRDDDGKLLRKLEEICRRWRNFCFLCLALP